MREYFDHAEAVEPCVLPLLAGRRKSSGDGLWDDPDELAHEEFKDLDEVDDEEELEDDVEEEEEFDEDEDLADDFDDDDTASLDELEDEEEDYEDEREDWDS
jgi:hypothetical protein